MKRLIPFLFLVGVLQAQTVGVSTLTSNVPLALITASSTIYQLKCINNEATTKTLTFYDTGVSTNVTNWVTPAWTQYTEYPTNYSTTFTNQSGVVITNTFSGIYRAAVAVSASTSTHPALITVALPASATVTLDRTMTVAYGLSAQGNGSITVQYTYITPP